MNGTIELEKIQILKEKKCVALLLMIKPRMTKRQSRNCIPRHCKTPQKRHFLGGKAYKTATEPLAIAKPLEHHDNHFDRHSKPLRLRFAIKIVYCKDVKDHIGCEAHDSSPGISFFFTLLA